MESIINYYTCNMCVMHFYGYVIIAEYILYLIIFMMYCYRIFFLITFCGIKY